MKKIFLNNWFFYFGGTVVSMIFIGTPIMMVYGYIVGKQADNPTVDVLLYFMIIFIPIGLICEFIIIKGFFQWTYIDNEIIVSRHILGIIRKIKWSDVLEVKEIDANFSTVGTKLGWICIYDNKEGIKESNGVAGKNTYIMIRNTKKNKKVIEHYWGKSIANKD
jgi:hypothetical protein